MQQSIKANISCQSNIFWISKLYVYNQSRVRPNQSLKLTEPAVGDFARAKQPATIGLDLPRADWIPSLRRFAAAA